MRSVLRVIVMLIAAVAVLAGIVALAWRGWLPTWIAPAVDGFLNYGPTLAVLLLIWIGVERLARRFHWKGPN